MPALGKFGVQAIKMNSRFLCISPHLKCTSNKLQAPSNRLDKTSQIIYDEGIMTIRKKLVKEIKKTNPDLAEEIKYMTKKEFRALMEVFNVWCRL